MTARQTQNTATPKFDLKKHLEKINPPLHLDLRKLSQKYLAFPLKVVRRNGRNRLLLAMRNTSNHQAIYDIEFKAGMSVIPVQADEVDIQWLIHKYFLGRTLNTASEPSYDDVTHNMFEQLSITTDAQARPDWVENTGFYAFGHKDQEPSK